LEPKEGTLNKLKNGTFKGVLISTRMLRTNLYVIDGAFVNETEADSFKWNEFAGRKQCFRGLNL
jgi:hypothetical protein